MKRKIIKIDEEKCTGCGLCVPGCHEEAIKIIDGKAKLVSDVYCDGLGAVSANVPKERFLLWNVMQNLLMKRGSGNYRAEKT